MDTPVGRFRSHVIELSNNSKQFRHHDWFITHHLEIVERIALELTAIYPDADADLVTALVWLHDYGKIIDFDRQYELTLAMGPEKLREAGFDAQFIEKALSYVEIMDSKETTDLSDPSVPIEVRIVSSADGCAHLVGPFLYLWWYENPGIPYEELMAGNLKKIEKDWNKKIVLPEARAAFEHRYRHAREQAGTLPDSFLHHG